MTELKPPAAAFHQHAERARNRRGMTKSRLIELSGIARVTYDRLETQINPPRSSTILAIAKVLAIDIDEALNLAGLGAAPPSETTAQHTVEDALVAALRQRLPDVDETTIARVLLNTANILQGAAERFRTTPGMPPDA